MKDQPIKILIVGFLAALGVALFGCAERAEDPKEDQFYSPNFGLVEVNIFEPSCKFWVQAWSNDILSKGSWTGDCANGLAQGNGTLTVQLDAKTPGSLSYTGPLKNGYMDGYGSLKSVNFSDAGDRYTYTYQGSFVAGEKTGRGREHRISTDTDGSIFEQIWSGDFIEGKLSGLGRYLINRKNFDGSEQTEVKQGSFANHFLHGPGIKTNISRSSSEGVRSSSYKGQWDKGYEAGFGVLVESTANGTNTTSSRYLGKWGGGGRNGAGIQYFGPKDYFKGTWKAGTPVIGYCDLKSEDYSGPCRLYEYHTSDHSGVRCLASTKSQTRCFEVWQSRWVS